MGWADGLRRVRVRTNADTPHDAKIAREFGAEGIGLCRTEHMFFEPAPHPGGARDDPGRRHAPPRERALAKLAADAARRLRRHLPRDGRPAGHDPAARPAAARVPAAQRRGDPRGGRGARHRRRRRCARKIEALREFNPMLGHRGCRLGITYPGDLPDAGARDRARRRCEVAESGSAVRARDHDPARRRTTASWRDCAALVGRGGPRRAGSATQSVQVRPKIGTMIEVPRAALTAGRDRRARRLLLLRHQRPDPDGLRLSRDDAGSFLPTYLELGILESDPFVSIDEEGVGALMRIAAEQGRAAPQGPQARHLRRARRRPDERRLLPPLGLRLRLLLALPRAGRAARRRAGGVRAGATLRRAGRSR